MCFIQLYFSKTFTLQFVYFFAFEPQTYEATKNPKLRNAMEDEIEAMKINKT